jgi:hypothetical protein
MAVAHDSAPLTRRTILYYPTIAIPAGTWLRQAALYWDEVAAIVPERWEATNEYPSDIRALSDAGQFRPIRPEDLFRPSYDVSAVKSLWRDFRSRLDDPLFTRQLTQGPGAHLGKRGFLLTYDVWNEKLPIQGDKLIDDLVRRKLLRRPTGDENDVYWLEPNTALLYLGLLAKYLADKDANYTVPGTDQSIYERLIFDPVKGMGHVNCVDVRLNRVLPVPAADVSMNDIVRFKHERRDELLAFRVDLDKFQRELAVAESHDEAKRISTVFAEQIALRVGNLTRVLHEARVENWVGSVKALINVKSPAFWAATAGAAFAVSNPIAWATAGFALAGTVELATRQIGGWVKQSAVLAKEPVAFLYHAERQGILPAAT